MQLKRLISTVLLTIFATSAALAQTPGPFSADEILTPAKHAAEPITGKVYSDGKGQMRIDMKMRGHESTSIVDSKKQVIYNLMPQQQMYMEMRLDQMNARGQNRVGIRAYDASNPCANQADYTCEKVGGESVNGRPCDKWEFTSQRNNEKHWVWIDEKNHIPIKTVTQDGTSIELKNIQEGPQPASLFQIPSGYQKLDMSEMMKGMADKTR